MTEDDRCTTHIELNASADNCPLCIAADLFQPYDDLRGYSVTPNSAERERFCEWIAHAMTVYDRANCDWIAERLVKTPGEMLRQWRRETGPNLERLTVAVAVCSDCGVFIDIKPWQGPDAWLGYDHTVTHGMCDQCCDQHEAA